MSNPIDSERRFRADLDLNLLKATFEEDTVARNVETKLLVTVEERASDPYLKVIVYRLASETIRRVIEVWCPSPYVPEWMLSKLDLGYVVKQVTASSQANAVDGALAQEVVGCLTTPMKGVRGSYVPPSLIEEIVKAASKVYLILAQAADKQEQELAQQAQDMYRTPFKSRRVESDMKTATKIVHTISPEHPDYDPLFPVFTQDSPGVIGLGPQEVKSITPQKRSKAKGRTLGGTQQNIASFLQGSTLDQPAAPTTTPSTPAEHNRANPSNFTAVTTASAPSPTKSALSPATPSSATDSPRGNFAHGPPVPWHQDEEDYIKGLIVISRGEMTWAQLAEASNEYFRDKPIIKAKTSELIQRGNRNMQALRQNPRFKGWEDQDWWFRLDEEWKDIGGPGLVVDWAAFKAKVDGREHAAAAAAAVGPAEATGERVASVDTEELLRHSVRDAYTSHDLDGDLEAQAKEHANAAYGASGGDYIENELESAAKEEGSLDQTGADVEMEDEADALNGESSVVI